MTTPAQGLTHPDSQTFNVSLSRGIIELALQGFQRYRPILEQLTGIESAFGLQQSPTAKEIEWIDSLISFCKKNLEGMLNLPFRICTVEYGLLRWLKAGMLLRTDELRAQRDTQFAKYTSLPVSLVQAINSRIAECENLAESGMFNSMTPKLL